MLRQILKALSLGPTLRNRSKWARCSSCSLASTGIAGASHGTLRTDAIERSGVCFPSSATLTALLSAGSVVHRFRSIR